MMWINIWILVYAFTVLQSAEVNVEEPPSNCIPGVKTFSSNYQRFFYKCQKEGDLAIYTQCPNQEIYWPEREECYRMADKGTSGRTRRGTTDGERTDQRPVVEERKVLGPVVLGLGDLYDAKTDRFLAGTSLWSEKTIQAAKRKQNQLSSVIKYSTGRTLYEKLDEMDISASLKLNFLGGLISISGGADFYRESSVLEDEETFNVVYETKTHSEVLPIGTKKEYEHVCASKDATHVVSQIVYGQRGYLSFKHKVSKSSESQNIKGSLQVLVKSTFSIDGKGSVNLKGNQKKLAETTEATISGDFVLDTIPTSFTETIKTFKRLASSNGKDTNTIPVKPVRVQLTPLWKYCDKSTTILIRISATMLDETAKVLNNLEKLHSKVKTLLATKPALRYLTVKKNLHIFQTFVENYSTRFKGKLQTILPLIRQKKGKSEADMNRLISSYISSPAKFDRSSHFLSKRNREIRAIQYLLDTFDVSNQDNIQVADYESANDVDISLRYPHLTVFSVNILQPRTITESFINGTEIDESNFWFNDVKAVGHLGYQIRLFKEFAEVNNANKNLFYLVKINKKSLNPATVIAIARSKYMAFEIPTRPDQPSFVRKDHNSITIKINAPTNSLIKKVYVKYWNVIKGEGSALKTDILEISNSIIKIQHLEPATYYQYRIIHYTEFGDSPSSIAGDVVFTSPSSPPTNLNVKEVLEEQITIAWRKPVHIGRNITIIGYKVLLYRKDLVIDEKNTNQDTFLATFQSLVPAEVYNVKVTVVARKLTSTSKVSVSESESAALRTVTLPKSPTFLTLISTSLYSINITWNVPIIAENAQVIEYIIQHTVLNKNGSKAILGTERTQSALTANQVTLLGLAQDTTYGIKVKVKTSLGTSAFSIALVARTEFDSSDLEKLRDSIETNVVTPKINAAVSAIMKEMKKTMQNEQSRNDLVEDNNRYLMQTISGLLPFGALYGDILQTPGHFGSFTIKSDMENGLSNRSLSTIDEVRVDIDGIISLRNNDRDVLRFGGFMTNVVTNVADAWLYIRANVTNEDRKMMDVDINRYLYINNKPCNFRSTAAILVTHNNTARHEEHWKRFTFQMALVTDGIELYGWTSYKRLDHEGRAGYWALCNSKPLNRHYSTRPKSMSLQMTSNIGIKGRHVIPVTC